MNLPRERRGPVRPPVKASMIIVRGLNGQEVRGEDWGKVEHAVYTTLPPKRMERCDLYFDLVVLVPGMAPIKSEAIMYRGCNCLAVDSGVVIYL